jgi:acetate kinase
MSFDQKFIMAINAGSSSIKFALYEPDSILQLLLSGKIERIGLPGTTLSVNSGGNISQENLGTEVGNFSSAAKFLIAWLANTINLSRIRAVGHRLVHGMQHTQPELITANLLAELHRISTYDPEHLPGEIALIEIFQRHFPLLPQVACFDTAFHCSMPRVAKILPVPRRFDTAGIQRYGFHGLSYEYLLQQLTQLAGTTASHGRVILAHLGNGASLAAVHHGLSIDTSMGFTPAGGLVMGSRSGDLDPGAAWYLMQSEKLNPQQFNHLVNHESGLLGISETSSDMRDLLAYEATDIRAAEAVELFCYQVKKWIGAYAAALGGLDTLVFSGGIGENMPGIRARICAGLAFLGIEMDENANDSNAGVISLPAARVAVRVINTNEELMIAKSVLRTIGNEIKNSEKISKTNI